MPELEDPADGRPFQFRTANVGGWAIFNGHGNCVACHSGALFNDGSLEPELL